MRFYPYFGGADDCLVNMTLFPIVVNCIAALVATTVVLAAVIATHVVVLNTSFLFTALNLSTLAAHDVPSHAQGEYCAARHPLLILGRCASSSRLIASPSFAFTYATLPSVFLSSNSALRPVLPSPALQLPYSPSAAFTFNAPSSSVPGSPRPRWFDLRVSVSYIPLAPLSKGMYTRRLSWNGSTDHSKALLREERQNAQHRFFLLHELRGTENEVDMFISMIWERMSSHSVHLPPLPKATAPQLVACGPLAARAVITNRTHTGSAPSPFGPLADVPPTPLEGFVLAVHADHPRVRLARMRSGYRIAEFTGGVNGFLSTHEGYFYIFDTLPLWSVMDLYTYVAMGR
ncbi:hypothetical protein B0H11DRAFT_2216075 [Mycena galericulata]|nr:hypothetical protein B0H11DRAFT_2216075 [Mycena galericulata]